MAVGQQHQILPSVFHVEDYMMSSGFRKSDGPCACEILSEFSAIGNLSKKALFTKTFQRFLIDEVSVLTSRQ